MSTPTATILPVEEADLPFLGDFLYSCKLELSINRLLFQNWPNEPLQKSMYSGAVNSGFDDKDVECVKAVNEKGEIVGYLALSRKRAAAKTETSEAANARAGDGQGEGDAKPSAPEGLDPRVLSGVISTVTELNKETEERLGGDRFEVTYICVKQPHRRQHIGSQLMQTCFDRAKAENVPLSVQSEPAAYPFFEKLGFTEMKHVDMDLSEWVPAKYTGFGVFRLSAMVCEVERLAKPCWISESLMGMVVWRA